MTYTRKNSRQIDTVTRSASKECIMRHYFLRTLNKYGKFLEYI